MVKTSLCYIMMIPFFKMFISDSGHANEAPSLPITPSYLKHPVFPYSGDRVDEPNPIPDLSSNSHHSPAVQSVRTGPIDPRGKIWLVL